MSESKKGAVISPEKAYLYRITHIDNLAWMLAHGLHCRNSAKYDPNYIEIGRTTLIAERKEHAVPITPGGTLSDYIPFYFTPYSPMLLNIKTGRGVPQRPMSDIVILVASLRKLAEAGNGFVYTDRHAFMATARFTNELDLLEEWVPWDLLQARDFQRDLENPGKFERYQAEALIHDTLSIEALLGVIVYDLAGQDKIQALANDAGVGLRILVQPDWYF